jgi:hypothetical protein
MLNFISSWPYIQFFSEKGFVNGGRIEPDSKLERIIRILFMKIIDSFENPSLYEFDLETQMQKNMHSHYWTNV